MSHGFTGTLLRVNLDQGRVTQEQTRMDWARAYLGGVGLATRYHYQEVPGGSDPLGPANHLIFMTGPLTGTSSASASRYSVVAKSPLTGIWGHANSGGSFGPAMKFAGVDGVIFEGISPRPVYLFIHDGMGELREAGHLWGKSVPETDDALVQEIGASLTVACIGPAGENLVRYAAIMNNKHRAAGRCGLGAVMGSKRLKAIACAGRQPVPLADEARFRTAVTRQRSLLDKSLLKVAFETYGTNMLADMVNVRGGYPTRNWQEGRFDGIEQVNGVAMTENDPGRRRALLRLPGRLRPRHRDPRRQMGGTQRRRAPSTRRPIPLGRCAALPTSTPSPWPTIAATSSGWIRSAPDPPSPLPWSASSAAS